MRNGDTFWIGLAFFAAVGSTAAFAGVKEGVDAWQAGDHAKAVAEWRQPAEQGDPDAQFNLGQAYKLGRGVPMDSKIAQSWYLKAAQQGHEQAQANLGLILFQNGDRAGAMPWIRKAAEHGEPRAQYVLGTALFNGDLVPRDWPRAYAYMTRSAAAGLPQASSSLQQMDQYLSVGDRQAGVALARDMETAANGGAAPQVAAKPVAKPAVKPVPVAPSVPKVAAASKPVPPVAPKPVPPAAPKAVAVATAAPPAQPAPVKKAVETAAPAAPKSGNWKVQLGAYGSAAGAEKAWAEINKIGALQGTSPEYIPVAALTRLRAGPFAGKAAANQACAQIQKAAHACFPVAP